MAEAAEAENLEESSNQEDGSTEEGQEETSGEGSTEEEGQEEEGQSQEQAAGNESSEEEGEEGDVTYDSFSLPEGFKLEGDRLDSFNKFSNELGFNQEEAQKVVDYFVKMQTGEMSALEDRLAQRAKDDIAAVYGWKSLQAGDGVEANVGLANTGIARLQDTVNNIFGDDAISLFKHLKDRGLDTDPGITQMAYAHATTVSEDTLVKDRGNPVVKKDRQDVMYPPTESG